MSESKEEISSIDENSNVDENEESEDIEVADKETENNTLKRKANPHESNQKKAKVKDKGDLYKPPTREELNRLQETENLFNSNLFRLQIEELLTEVKAKDKHISAFESWYKEFHKFITNIPEYNFTKEADSKISSKKSKKLKQVADEIEKNVSKKIICDQKEVTVFPRPYCVDIFGLHKINATIGPTLEIKIKIIIPKTFFREKDYLNNRYTIKQNYYLSYIVMELNKSNLCSKIQYFFEHGDVPLPELLITPYNNEKITVRIYIAPQETVFKYSRFEPMKNNVKLNIFRNVSNINEDLLKDSPTPFYNSMLARDATLEMNYKFMEDYLGDLKNVQDGIKLATVWLKQRSLTNAHIGFSEELAAFALLYLVSKKRLNKHMSSYQVIRNFWSFLSTTDWCKNPISLCDDVKEERLKQFSEHFDVVFVDRSGYYNLAAFIDVNVYFKVKAEAELAVQLLDKVQFNSFSVLFMTRVPFELQYDSILMIQDEKQFSKLFDLINEEDKHRHIGFYEFLIRKHITNFLKIGLNKRIMRIVPHPNDGFTQMLGSQIQPPFDKIVFGITLDPEYAYKVVEVGPPADDEEKALGFRHFWGELSHCRRFNDGSIHEAVYFEAETCQDKRKIFKRITDFVLSKKLNIKCHYLFCDELENFIIPYGSSTIEEPTLKIITTFDELTKLLRSLTLPLDITAIHGKSDVFCYSDLFPPLPTACHSGKKVILVGNNIILKEGDSTEWIPKYCAPIECVIHLSLHSKWPNDLEALKHVKTAFYLKISELLKNQHNIKSNVRPEHFDIYFKGYMFRFTLYHPKEVGFLKKQTDSSGLISYKDTEESLHYERELNILCKINGALNGIQSQFPSFGPSCTLIKRWLRSQLIDNFYFPDVVINMLNASIYLNNAPFKNANLPQIQFLRFLKFICEYDWNLNPIVINFNDELTKEQLDTFETNFHQNRENCPLLYIITPYDDGKSLFTQKSCTKEILKRISILAAATHKIIVEDFLGTFDPEPLKSIFVPNLEGYNLLIHLKPFLNSRRYQQLAFTEKVDKMAEIKQLHKRNNFGIPVTGFNPVSLYLDELRGNYGEFALFFHNPYGGCVIAVLWKPSALEDRDFKVSSVNGRKLNDKNKLVFNEDAIVEDFYILGKDLVKTIEKR